jgi:hypothetical protein
MRWVRTKRRSGAWLALAAMALQLVLSFGHIHLEDLKGGGNGVVTAAASKAASAHQDPAGGPAGDADDYCPICAVLHLAAASFVPDAPVLPVPFAFHAIAHASQPTFASVLLRRAPFQSRAPPLA